MNVQSSYRLLSCGTLSLSWLANVNPKGQYFLNDPFNIISLVTQFLFTCRRFLGSPKTIILILPFLWKKVGGLCLIKVNRFKEIFFPECANSRQRADGSQVCYLKGPNGVSYTEALEFCQKQGMVLAEIKTPSELENVVAFATVTNNYTQPSKYNAKVPTKKFIFIFCAFIYARQWYSIYNTE